MSNWKFVPFFKRIDLPYVLMFNLIWVLTQLSERWSISRLPTCWHIHLPWTSSFETQESTFIPTVSRHPHATYIRLQVVLNKTYSSICLTKGEAALCHLHIKRLTICRLVLPQGIFSLCTCIKLLVLKRPHHKVGLCERWPLWGATMRQHPH